MRVREAEFKEIPKIVELLEKANAEFGHASIPFCHDTTRNTLQRVINQREHVAFLLVGEDNTLQGIMVGLTNQLWYSRKRQIVDLIYYVEKESRGHGARLMTSFLAWARSVPNVMEISLGITSGIDTVARVEGLLKASGLKKVGALYSLHPAEDIEHEQSA